MDHYNGYRNGIMSLWSVGNFLNQKRIDNYWRNSGLALDLFPLFEIKTVSSFMCKMLSGIYNHIEISYVRKISFREVCELKKNLL